VFGARPDPLKEQTSLVLQTTEKVKPAGFPFGVALGTATNNAHSATVIAILVFMIWFLSSAGSRLSLNSKVSQEPILGFIER
jgi:hypothetical protein